MPIDNVLKLYSETIQSSFLHYGFWDQPSQVDLDLFTLNDIKNAQLKYAEHLCSYIPTDVNSILDVGCGIGGNTEYLLSNNFEVEVLSPDNYQKSVINSKFNGKMKFHHTKFENFASQKKFDLIFESESACYIKIDAGFKKAREVLNNQGYLLASDYFVFNEDRSGSPHLKSSHRMNEYLSSAEENNFQLIKEYDQTENTMPTLDYAQYFLDRFISPAIDYGSYSAKKNYPIISNMIKRVIGSKWDKKKEQLDLINSQEFRKYRKYMIYLFQKK
tara:strand:+ start:3905 stop:4726 length:822 start_codon:yes stop_codon:yes gene_type:complete